jgi:uncharacterized membrane protein YraQ (UPF0718 family)
MKYFSKILPTILVSFFFSSFIFCNFSQVVFADGLATPGISQNTPTSVKLMNPLKVNTIQDAVKAFMSAIVRIAIPFIVVFFIWSGFNFIVARGNEKKITDAKNMFLYTIIGTLLILGAWVITNAIVGTVNSIGS